MPLDIQTRILLSKSDPEAFAWIFEPGRIAAEDSFFNQRLGDTYLKYLKLEEMLLDPQVRGKLGERVGALLGRNVIVESATPTEKDVAAKDLIEQSLNSSVIPYESICSNFLYSGLLIGFAVQAVQKATERTIYIPKNNDKGELIKVEEKTLIVPELEFVPQRRFVFYEFEPEDSIPWCTDEDLDPEKDQTLVNGYELRILTKRSPVRGERCPRDRFFTYTFGSLKGLPAGYGLGAMIRKFYEIRNECLKSGVMSGDRLGSPPVHGTYPSELSERDPEQGAIIGMFRRMIAAISPNAHAVTTDGFKVNFLEPRTGGHALIKWLYETSGVEITRAVWGEGSYSEKETGSYAADQQQAANRNENTVDADCNNIDEQLQVQFWGWIKDKNFPDANAPIVRRETYADRRQAEQEKAKEEFRNQRAATDRTLILDLGLTVDQGYIDQTYGEAFRLPPTEPPPEDAPPDESFSEDFGANVHRFIDWQGLKIGVRSLPGETRFPQHRTGRKLRDAYGFVVGAKHQGKAIRCYVCPSLLDGQGTANLYEIRQLNPADGSLDEVKLAIAYPTMAAAEQAYKQAMPDRYFGGIRQIEVKDLQQYSSYAESEPTAIDNEIAIAEAYEERLNESLAESFKAPLARIQEFVDAIAQSDGTDEQKYRRFVDGVYGLFSEMGGEREAIAGVIGEAIAASYLAGMHSEREEE